jgi:hypothetical protein
MMLPFERIIACPLGAGWQGTTRRAHEEPRRRNTGLQHGAGLESDKWAFGVCVLNTFLILGGQSNACNWATVFSQKIRIDD